KLKLNDIQNAINLGIQIYKSNNGQETIERSSNYVNEYYALGRNNPVDVRKLATIREAIKSSRASLGGRFLTRSELLKIIIDVASSTQKQVA
ncbi:hypothetical protein, partial [Clostridium sp. HBUAS56017]|uniref:hypothetical protein n=1 Tax=Clostridium sp. HBUAS56017 TaxID=2571128 RepID=UPI00163DD6A9